jgi:hypothetical protein
MVMFEVVVTLPWRLTAVLDGEFMNWPGRKPSSQGSVRWFQSVPSRSATMLNGQPHMAAAGPILASAAYAAAALAKPVADCTLLAGRKAVFAIQVGAG